MTLSLSCPLVPEVPHLNSNMYTYVCGEGLKPNTHLHVLYYL